jgi:hypothetical protein
MKRRFLGAVLCLLLLPIFGTARFLWSVLRVLTRRPRRLLVLGGLVVAVRSTNPAHLLALNGVGPMGHMIPFMAGAVGAVVLWHGLWSREFRWLWRTVRRHAAEQWEQAGPKVCAEPGPAVSPGDRRS